ncbi:hypothetical protein [Salisediminibacterium selenitireducens]|uniref:Uncharacterized protein n=1 Tax=Bacillus selenitireducens (strain ATCC 700615 / DSM 15326 / MLS10) TaxID=439292 RepID=D6XX60_BACIE|nr:hypothetical protein [Salisediminibacterium selenitireducens]ADH97917.1 hypothetical protein Bsel_0377 [[Bacillus] selenitireducens MLS10]
MSSVNTAIQKKVGVDLFSMQMRWAYWLIGVVWFLYLTGSFFSGTLQDFILLHFMDSLFQPAKIFMFVIGIISGVYLMPLFVQLGVTRRNYFIGATVATFLVSGVIMLFGMLLHTVTMGLTAVTPLTAGGGVVDFLPDELFLGWRFVIFTLIAAVYYGTGWLIAIGFYRFKTWVGMLTIPAAIFFNVITELFWDSGLNIWLFFWIEADFSGSLPVSFVATVLILGVLYGIIRKLTADVAIKVK